MEERTFLQGLIFQKCLCGKQIMVVGWSQFSLVVCPSSKDMDELCGVELHNNDNGVSEIYIPNRYLVYLIKVLAHIDYDDGD